MNPDRKLKSETALSEMYNIHYVAAQKYNAQKANEAMLRIRVVAEYIEHLEHCLHLAKLTNSINEGILRDFAIGKICIGCPAEKNENPL